VKLKRCEECDSEFIADPDRADWHRFCTPRCRYRYRDQRKPGIRSGTTVQATCVFCGSGFEYIRRTKPRITCSEPCRLAQVGRVRSRRQLAQADASR
jgi:hypothetical protein